MIKGIKKTDYIFSLYILFGLIIFVLLIYNVRLSNEDIKSIVEIVLNTSSITMGFATVFTFIFGFKDNYIHKRNYEVERRKATIQVLKYLHNSDGLFTDYCFLYSYAFINY